MGIKKLKSENLIHNEKLNLLLKEKNELKEKSLDFLNIKKSAKFEFAKSNFSLGFISFFIETKEKKYAVTFHSHEGFKIKCALIYRNLSSRETRKKNIIIFFNDIYVPNKEELNLFNFIQENFLTYMDNNAFLNKDFQNNLVKLSKISRKILDLRKIIHNNNYNISLKENKNHINDFKKVFDTKKEKHVPKFFNKDRTISTFYLLYKEEGIVIIPETINVSWHKIKSMKNRKNKQGAEFDKYYIIENKSLISIKDFISKYSIPKKYKDRNYYGFRFIIPYKDIKSAFKKVFVKEKINNF